LLGDEAVATIERCGVTHVLSSVHRQRVNNLIAIMKGLSVRPKYALYHLSQKLRSLPQNTVKISKASAFGGI